MSLLKWDEPGEHFYENGVEKGVLYVKNGNSYGKGVAWNGLTNVTLSPEGAEANDIYADNIKYLSLLSAENLNATIEAYQSPQEFDECDGSADIYPVSGQGSVTLSGIKIGQQPRKQFAFCFTTRKGNENGQINEIIHIIYGCTASPSERAYETINDSPDAMTLSWDVTTVPVPVTGFQPTALVTIDASKVNATKLQAIKDKLFGKDPSTEGGTDGNDPELLTPNQIITILSTNG